MAVLLSRNPEKLNKPESYSDTRLVANWLTLYAARLKSSSRRQSVLASKAFLGKLELAYTAAIKERI